MKTSLLFVFAMSAFALSGLAGADWQGDARLAAYKGCTGGEKKVIHVNHVYGVGRPDDRIYGELINVDYGTCKGINLWNSKDSRVLCPLERSPGQLLTGDPIEVLTANPKKDLLFSPGSRPGKKIEMGSGHGSIYSDHGKVMFGCMPSQADEVKAVIASATKIQADETSLNQGELDGSGLIFGSPFACSSKVRPTPCARDESKKGLQDKEVKTDFSELQKKGVK
jgi:hypothetical protein